VIVVGGKGAPSRQSRALILDENTRRVTSFAFSKAREW
jgi:hypothetical protein